jgi:HPt (histidine-containing phosphotransfer) domain-containing protein
MPDHAIDGPALAELLESVNGDREFLGELIEAFIADSPTLFAQLRGGLASGDAGLVRQAAHTLKSTSASFGALRLAEACRAMEAQAAAGDLARLEQPTVVAEAEFEAVVAALRVVAANDPAGTAT